MRGFYFKKINGGLKLGAALLASSLLLSACTAALKDDRELYCPSVGILKDAEFISQYEPGMPKTPENLITRGRLAKAAISCTRSGDELSIYVEYLLNVVAGPKTESRNYDLPYFAALVKNQRLVHKINGTSRVTFTDLPQISVIRSIEGIRIKLLKDESPEAYEVLIGFQIDEKQMLDNRK
jgi:hypothetical protein